MNNSFSKYHPVTNLLFFVVSIGFAMFLMQPVCLCLTLVISLVTALSFNGKKTALFSLRILLPLIILTAVINPVFNHAGVTIITYLPWGNPLTLESILYGIAAAALLSSTALWFSCFNKVMTSDKLVYLFGRLLPSLSLVLSMALRFVPRFNEQLREVRKAQKAIGKDISDGTILVRLKNGVKILSLMISRSLENSVDTSDSMRSRGYGLKGRTAFSLYRLSRKDAFWLAVMGIETVSMITLCVFGAISFRWFPDLKGELSAPYSLLFYFIYSLFLLTPLIINAGEGYKWKRSASKI